MIAFRNPIPEYQPPKPFVSFPCARLVIHIKFSVCAVMHRWLLQAYTRDVRSRLPQLLATATSIYGRILKIDSTKKVVKKLQGAAADTATWVTNVGNEKGEVLISVVTESEGLLSLKPMADGLIKRLVYSVPQMVMCCIVHLGDILDTERLNKTPQ